uniref:Uncharacterized protein LOC104237069 n=1 Tax=Nicotiana sylvestris TaxID=4096 RepID=A0A1U7XF03_NICSY|nr:PREDICTED: uncharacterized protein LOC104237069 [Nicotiana sylvestris]
MEVYIDDMFVKSLNVGDHRKHLQGTFDILRKHNMKLNHEMCMFGVNSGKFLGFRMSRRGIEVNPAKSHRRHIRPAVKHKRGSKAHMEIGLFEKVHFPIIREMPPFLYATQKEEQLRVDPGMATCFKEFEKILVKTSVTIKAGGRFQSETIASGTQKGIDGARIVIRRLDPVYGWSFQHTGIPYKHSIDRAFGRNPKACHKNGPFD